MRATTVPVGPELAATAGRPPDWQHAASVPAIGGPDAEGWARACFEQAPLWMRLFLTIGWRLLLLEGSARSDATHVLGWPILTSSAEMSALHRHSRLGIDATLVFSVAGGSAVFASGMAFDNRLARVMWAFVAPTHRWAVRAALSHASTHLP